jgi:hypothetical protein
MTCPHADAVDSHRHIIVKCTSYLLYSLSIKQLSHNPTLFCSIAIMQRIFNTIYDYVCGKHVSCAHNTPLELKCLQAKNSSKEKLMTGWAEPVAEPRVPSVPNMGQLCVWPRWVKAHSSVCIESLQTGFILRSDLVTERSAKHTHIPLHTLMALCVTHVWYGLFNFYSWKL